MFLNKIIQSNSYYENQKINKSSVKSLVKTNNKENYFSNNDDFKHRINLISKYIKKKSILDFGCGIGDSFDFLLNFSSDLSGVEISKKKIKLLKKNYKYIPIKKNISDFKNNFDIVTMFHVLAHLPKQIETLASIYKKLNKNGYLIVETLHSNDFLSRDIKLNEYNKFRFSKEFSILHSEKSIKKILNYIGFSKIKVIFHQRYNYLNLINWIFNKRPNGHHTLKKFYDSKLDKKIKKIIVDNKKTDTLVIIAKK